MKCNTPSLKLVCNSVRVDGGRFFRGSVVKVERIDLYDYRVILAEQEFQSIKRIADDLGLSMEHALHIVIEKGIDFELDDLLE